MKHLHITIDRKSNVVKWRIGNRAGSDPADSAGCLSATLGEIIRCAIDKSGSLSVEIHTERGE